MDLLSFLMGGWMDRWTGRAHFSRFLVCQHLIHQVMCQYCTSLLQRIIDIPSRMGYACGHINIVHIPVMNSGIEASTARSQLKRVFYHHPLTA